MDRKLPHDIASSDDLQLLILEVKKVIDLSRERAVRKTGAAGSELALSPSLRELLGLGSGDAVPGVNELTELQKWLEQAKSTAPQVNLTLPGVPGQAQKEEIITWFRRQIHPLALVSFEYNRGLAGGFALRLGSQVYDYSFRHALLSNSTAMAKVMKNV